MRRVDTLVILALIVVLVAFGGGLSVTAPLRPTAPPPLAAIPAPTQARPFVEGVVGPVGTVDPLYAVTTAERSVASLLFRGLMRITPDGSVEGDLAASWTTDPGGLAYEVVLRTDQHWHDGRLVTADDVVATWSVLTDPGYEGPAGGRWTGVTVQRVDRFTVRFGLAAPDPGLLTALVQPVIPAHGPSRLPLALRAPARVGSQTIGSGPFRLVTLRDDLAVFRRPGPPRGGQPPGYRADVRATAPERVPIAGLPPRPRLEEIRMRIFRDSAELAEAFRVGSVDMATGLLPDDVTSLMDADGVATLRYPTARVFAVLPNVQTGNEPLRDAAARRGVSLAIDRDRLVATAMAGAGVPVQTLVPPSAPVFDPELSADPVHDLEAARAGFRTAGWQETGAGWQLPGDAGSLGLELLVADVADPIGTDAADLVAEDLRAVGLEVDVVALDPDALVTRMRRGAFEAALVELEVGLVPDLFPLLVSSEAVPGGTNLGGYQSSLVDRLLAATRAPGDASDAIERWSALQAALAREMPIIPLAFVDEVVLTHDDVVGPTVRPVVDAGGRYWDVLDWTFASGPNT